MVYWLTGLLVGCFISWVFFYLVCCLFLFWRGLFRCFSFLFVLVLLVICCCGCLGRVFFYFVVVL